MQGYTNTPNNKNSATVEKEKIRKYIMLALSVFSVFMVLVLFFVPFCATEFDDSVTPISTLGLAFSSLSAPIAFVILFVLFGYSIFSFAGTQRSYSASESEYVRRTQRLIWFNTAVSGAYFLSGIIFTMIMNMLGKSYTTKAGSLICLFLSLITAVAFAVASRGIAVKDKERITKTPFPLRIEFFVYSVITAALTVAACLTDIIVVYLTKPSYSEALKLNGLDILNSYNGAAAGFQLIAFLLIAVLTITGILLVASLISLISGSKMFFRVTLAQIFCSGISSLLIGLFGKYYEIVQKLNEDTILTWINNITDLFGVDLEYKVKSSSFIWFAAVALVIAIVLIRKPYTKGTLREAVIAVNNSAISQSDSYYSDEANGEADAPAEQIKTANDPCPAFSELDGKIRAVRQRTEFNRAVAFSSPTLPSLVQFVVSYARDSRLHLSYSAKDIAAFVAGLGATRLTILQGMSGTGKTSLPKIFTEALLGNCDIIEVESSWRDKNELLGYYNEFSRTYTPKKFTQALYKARLDPEHLTFIVLDEMNLSRIEYYFSDFLSLMENEEDKREIKLLNVPLFRNINGAKVPYKGLSSGHTIKIPNNIWFIGTANRDESTFEISDKVYDRAHTMNFNKRASKAVSAGEPMSQRYLSAPELIRLLEEAKQSVRFDIESCALVREVEELLSPYNISFGNRVANQIEDFVRIYAACFTQTEDVINEAIETILLSKVVSKLEFRSVENKRELAAEFESRKLYRCSEFILKLNED